MKPTRWTPEMIEYYTSKGLWTSETWPDIYDRNAQLYPNKEAFIGYGRGKRSSVTWSEMKQWTDRLALGFLEGTGDADDGFHLVLSPSFIGDVTSAATPCRGTAPDRGEQCWLRERV